ncbi:ABC transporter substrate-binding protein [Pelagibacterium lacus]|uniref:Iron-siderophore ABC transporter substrate-binding protein n=1 Tax=Pelagibacterium lacus TaxID=2282655 RepID=A0A369W9K3_9HYPH|nr:iron-siderophore ABC transporter substrate-binding protein [Pelagibacterium lacus]RDE10545.1 iron-siderophore ABC transporter substrate-binding protein [Pelagibacterium lacus]
MVFTRNWARLAGGAALCLTLSAAPVMAQIARTVAVTAEGRVVEHALGETEIPLAPEKIVTLHNVFAEALIVMGLSPIGSVDRPSGLPQQLVDSLAGTTSVGLHSDPNFEMVLSLDPELILAQESQQGDNYERLSAIAPTLLLNEPDAEWREWYEGLGEALGRSAQVEAAIAAYDDRAAATKAALAEARGDETVLLLRVREKDIRVYGGARRSGPVLYDDLGLNPHEMVPLDADHTEISPENIPWLLADHIFVMIEDADRMDSIRQSDLWQRLPAVQNGQVYPVDIEPWNQSVGPISFSAIIDDVEAALLAD